MDQTTILNRWERPTNQEFLDFVSNTWANNIAHGNLKSSPEYLCDTAIFRILNGFKDCEDAVSYLQSFGGIDDEFLFFDEWGGKITKNLFRTAIYLKWDRIVP